MTNKQLYIKNAKQMCFVLIANTDMPQIMVNLVFIYNVKL